MEHALYIDQLTMVLRILGAAGLGMLVGLERESHGRAAGLRTCMLVAMAGALIMSLGLYLAQIFALPGGGSLVRLDPTRLPSYAIAGMGFLGAGAIIQGRLSARGVTTGAAMWTCTVVGLSVGAGLYLPAVVVVLTTLSALVLLKKVAHHIPHDQYVSLRVEARSAQCIPPVRRVLEEAGARVLFTGRHHCLRDENLAYRFSLVIRSGPNWGQVQKRLEEIPGVVCLDWQESKVP